MKGFGVQDECGHERIKWPSGVAGGQPPCMHEDCIHCNGTGIKKDGSACIHMISCPCPKCVVQ